MSETTHSAEDLKKHVRAYILVFVSLMVLTLVTVAVSTFHLPVHQAIAMALIIATVKGSLVACYFMHLISEKKLILWVMLLTVAFFAVLLLVPAFTVADRIGR
jgi:cytochrome c oxidase subunit 4